MVAGSMTKYNRVYLGKKSIYADEPRWNAPHLCDNLRTFNAWFVPTLQERFPEKTRVAARRSALAAKR